MAGRSSAATLLGMSHDQQSIPPPRPERTLDQLREQYEVERELARRLWGASRAERSALYSKTYDELFRRVLHHPQLTRSAAQRRSAIDAQLRILRPYLSPGLSFLEMGAGDCRLSLEVARLVKVAYAYEVSTELTRGLDAPANFRLLRSGGCEIPLPDRTVDFAYSYQLMEHIHPDDALDQLREILRILRPGGAYLCVTPNRLSGPHDVSRHFDRVSSGLHLREYCIGELARLYRQVGFARVRVERLVRSVRVPLPMTPLIWFERLVAPLPWPVRARLARSSILSRLLDVSVLGYKDGEAALN
jgi:SAM-dependent methyltransferase